MNVLNMRTMGTFRLVNEPKRREARTELPYASPYEEDHSTEDYEPRRLISILFKFNGKEIRFISIF